MAGHAEGIAMTAPVLDTEKVGITRTLAEYLTGLEYEDIPADAVELLKIFTDRKSVV